MPILKFNQSCGKYRGGRRRDAHKNNKEKELNLKCKGID